MTTHTTPTKAQLAQFLNLVNDPASAAGLRALRRRPAPHRRDDGDLPHDATTGWTAEQAFNEMKQYKFGADFLHPEFKEFVYGFHPETTKTSVAVAATSSTTTQR